MTGLDEFIGFLKEYFRGLVGAESRELFVCRGDPRGGGRRERGVVWVQGLDLYLSSFVRSVGELRQWNIYMGVGFLAEPGLTEPAVDKMLYDRLSFDFDSEESPTSAVVEALGFAYLLYSKYKSTPLVFETGFKGAHVIVPLSKPVDWEGYQLLWRHLYSLLPPATKRMVDLNMLQWNRVDRVPLTYNVKEEGVRFSRIVYPREFTWRDFNWDELQSLDPSSVTVVRVSIPNVVKPKVLVKPGRERRWIWRIVESGLPDGRKRLIFQVLVPYLVNVRGLKDEEVFEVCHEFIENSCRNHGACEKIYNSWIRDAIKSARKRGFRGFGLERFKEMNSDIRSFLEKILGE